jgi:thymidylate kinase
MVAMNRGLFIVIYGPSGVGKTKQLDLLEEKLKGVGVPCKRVEYPLYKLGEAGPKLEKIVWRKLPQPPEKEMQELFAENRRDFEETLKSWLQAGVTVIAEDYKGTGMVWGLTRGMPEEEVKKINEGFLDPDLNIFIDGPRRTDLHGDPSHVYNASEEEWYRARDNYLFMADRNGWVKVDADAPMVTVAARIWAVVRPVLAMRGK